MSAVRRAARQNQSRMAEIGSKRSTFNKCKAKVDSLSNGWEMENAKTGRARDALDNAIRNLAEAQETIDLDYLPEGAQPPARIHKRDNLALAVAQLEAALEAQKRTTARGFDAWNASEREMFEAEKNLHQLMDVLEDVEEAKKIQIELDQAKSDRLAKLEYKRADRWEKEQESALDARADEVMTLNAKAQKQLKVTKESNKKAVKRINKAVTERREIIGKIAESEEVHQVDRREAVLQLMADTNKAKMAAAKSSDNVRRKAEAATKQLEDEKEALLAKGINPYVEFRTREFREADQAKDKQLKDLVVMNKQKLANRLIIEEQGIFKEEAADQKARQYEKKHRDEQGRSITEEKNTAYIKSVMTGGYEVLDPTGRAPRVDPSQVTQIKDQSFGLANSQRIPKNTMKSITEKIRRNLKVDEDDLGEYQRLLSGLVRLRELCIINRSIMFSYLHV